jgi:hypothetical protein
MPPRHFRSVEHSHWAAALLLIGLTAPAVGAPREAGGADAMGNEPWSLSIYGGPWSQRVFTDIVGRGDFAVSGGMIGVAADARLFQLGGGFSLAAEGQFTQTLTGHSFETFGIGLGVRFDQFPWRRWLPTSIAVFTGPSYAVNPPIEYYDPSRPQHPWLNYVGIELAVGLPGTRHWDGVIRFYHRSGVWGLYSINADEGSTVGIGLRYRW